MDKMMSWTLSRLVTPAREADHTIEGDRCISRFFLADLDPLEPEMSWRALELRTFHDPRLKRYWAVLASVTVRDTPNGLSVHHGFRSPTRIVLEAVMPRFDQRTFARFDEAALIAARNRFGELTDDVEETPTPVQPKGGERKRQPAA